MDSTAKIGDTNRCVSLVRSGLRASQARHYVNPRFAHNTGLTQFPTMPEEMGLMIVYAHYTYRSSKPEVVESEMPFGN